MNDGILFGAVALDGVVEPSALELGWALERVHPYGRAYRTPEGLKVTVYGFGGAVVEGARELPSDLRAALEAATGRKVMPSTLDTYVVAEGAQEGQGPRVGWERIVVQTLRPEIRAAIALSVGQSAALERHEVRAQRLVEEARALADELGRTGRPPGQGTDLLKRIGGMTSERLALSEQFYLEDKPEETWEDREVAVLYDALFESLDMRDRRAAVLHKLAVAGEAIELVIDLWQARRSVRLEWAIIVIFVLDILMSLATLFASP